MGTKCICGKETNNEKYCSRSCSAKVTNKETPKRKPTVPLEWSCKNCGKSGKAECKSKIQSYCSVSCQQKHLHDQKIDEWLTTGKQPSSKVVKRYLLEKNNRCSHCGISVWNNLPIVLELEHKDGNAENNSMGNICLLCPNCHSQTPTYKGKNKGKGRHYRRQRYAEGKSY